jgi:hypothetical protein
VYCWTCPDGRRYIGGVTRGNKRQQVGLARSNPRIADALKTYPVETWVYEELARLPRGSGDVLYAVEQLYIEAYRTKEPDYGFNMHDAHHGLAVWRSQQASIIEYVKGLHVGESVSRGWVSDAA